MFEYDLTRSKRLRKEYSFENDFYAYVIDNDPLTYSKVVTYSESQFWKNAI